MDIRDFRIVGQQALAKDNARHPWSHSDHFHAWILRRQTCVCTAAGSSSSVSMQVARSAREMLKQCGRLRSVAVR